jgi:hypothetical protein
MRSFMVVVLVALSALAGRTIQAAEAENELLLSQAVDEALKNNPEILTLSAETRKRV